MNSNSVTTPKLPPPPRMAQNRSSFSLAEACSTRPSAVTTSAPTTLSDDSPARRDSQPRPPPRVSPGNSGVADEAARHGETVFLGGGVELTPGRAAAAGRSPRLGVDGHRLHGGEVDHETVVAQCEAGVVVSAAADGNLEAFPLPEDQRRGDVVATGATGDDGRAARDGVVPDVDRIVVTRLAGLRDGAAESGLQRVHGATGDVRHPASPRFRAEAQAWPVRISNTAGSPRADRSDHSRRPRRITSSRGSTQVAARWAASFWNAMAHPAAPGESLGMPTWVITIFVRPPTVFELDADLGCRGMALRHAHVRG